MTEAADLCAALECLLFLADRALSTEELAEAMEASPEQVEQALEQLSSRYRQGGLQVVRVAGGWQICTRPEYAEMASRLRRPQKIRLSRPALETLAVVAYRQPVTRPEIEVVRGVNVDGVMGTLLQYGMIRECGRKQAPGRPLLYATTDEFLIHFGLNSLEDLPDLEGTVNGLVPTMESLRHIEVARG